MKATLSIAGLLLALTIGAIGCARDPFACCDRRASCADWLDCYGCTGCGYRDGNCKCH